MVNIMLQIISNLNYDKHHATNKIQSELMINIMI
jgi:hypothetical protein